MTVMTATGSTRAIRGGFFDSAGTMQLRAESRKLRAKTNSELDFPIRFSSTAPKIGLSALDSRLHGFGSEHTGPSANSGPLNHSKRLGHRVHRAKSTTGSPIAWSRRRNDPGSH